MAITKLVITGNTTAVGISTTPITVSLEHKAESTSVASVGNITATNVQAALEQLDNIKVQSSYGTLDNPTFTGTVTFPSAISITDKLGIGINTPLADLHINNVIGSELRIDTTGGTDANSLLNFRESGVDKASLYWDGVDDELYLETTAGDISLMAAGNVGIGNTNPATALDVTGVITTNGLTSSAGIDVTGTVTADSLTVDTNTLYVDSTNDRVGIGTASPDQKLQVDGNIRLGDTATGVDDDEDYGLKTGGSLTLHANDSGNNTAYTALAFDVGNASGSQAASSKIQFRVNNTERMRIDSSGNVGIGTTTISNPVNYSKVLNIAGTAPALVLSEDSGRDYTIGVNGNKFSIFDETDAVLTIDDAGNVGIGTTSPQSDGNTTNLEVSSANGARVLVNNTDTSGRKYGIYSDNSGRFGFADYTADATRMLIDSSGNLGIGTASPAARLDVKNNTALGGTDGDWLLLSRIQSHTGNQTDLEIGNLRDSTGSTWQQAGTRIQSKIDATYMGYMQFNGTGNEHGISFGVGASTVSHDSIPEVMRITSSGNVLVGKTSGDNATAGLELNANGQLVGTFANGTHVLGRNGSDGNILAFIKDGADMGSIGTVLASGARYFYIGNNASNSGIGFYATGIYPSNGLGGFSSGNKNLGSSTVRWLTAYLSQQPNVSSDQRLKQNIEDADDAGSTIDAIQVRKFDWIEDGRHQKYGMIAQELAEVYPEAVNVAENEEDTLGIATGDLIPMLIKEVQSLRSRVAELESK